MGYGHVGSVATIWNYKSAQEFFNSKPAHTRCKGWQSHQRCLKERPSGNRHYRIEQHNDGEYYDVCLYSTVMARFYKPNDTGHCRILYAGHHTVTSQSFMHRVLAVWSAKRMVATDGRTIVMPIYNDNQLNDKGDLFSVDITIDSEHHIVVSESRHTPHYTHKSNDTDKQYRKSVKDRLNNYIMLAQMRMPEYAENCCPTHDKGRPFGGGATRYAERVAVEALLDYGADVERHHVDDFFEMCQDIYDTLVSKRGYDQNNFHLGYRYYSSNYGPQTSTPDDLEKPVTEKDFEKAILNRVYRLVNANTKSEAVPQPQFMDSNDYPRSSITTYR